MTNLIINHLLCFLSIFSSYKVLHTKFSNFFNFFSKTKDIVQIEVKF